MAEAVQYGRDRHISARFSIAILRERAATRVSCDGEHGQKTKRSLCHITQSVGIRVVHDCSWLELPSLDGLPSDELGELRVYPAYDPTLDPNTSVKVTCHSRVTCL